MKSVSPTLIPEQSHRFRPFMFLRMILQTLLLSIHFPICQHHWFFQERGPVKVFSLQLIHCYRALKWQVPVLSAIAIISLRVISGKFWHSIQSSRILLPCLGWNSSLWRIVDLLPGPGGWRDFLRNLFLLLNSLPVCQASLFH